jgi:uncharacterized membrane protein YqjE
VATRVFIDPDKGINDLVRQLAGDSKQLVADEIRLAKVETAESMHRAGHGALWLAVAFGVTVVALVAFTLFFATLIGRLVNAHYWVGAVVVGIIELGAGAWVLKRGLAAFAKAPYSLPETRTGLRIIRNPES